MTAFGDQLRSFRQRCHDSNRPHGRLTQESFGELVGKVLGIEGYTGAAVSDWERGKTRIHAEDRQLLMSIIHVLHEYGGISTIDQANQLLHAGNFRNLDPNEEKEFLQEEVVETRTVPADVAQKVPIPKSPWQSALESLISISEEELQTLIAKAQEGPSPFWPRLLAALMRKTSERISLSPKTVLWIVVWWIAWWLVAPSLRWPFENRAAALQAVGMYVVGTLVIPLLIGMLVDTRHNEYWEAQGLSRSRILRLYTYQGAGIGFNLGYFLILPLVLVRHYLNLGSSDWPAVIAVSLGLMLANMSARVVPHNLWLVYHRLRFGDGAIFFVVAFIGPLWALFFLEYYAVLLTPFWGGIIILVALLLFIMIPIGQSKRKANPEQAQP
jgi:hypothetical protein